MRLVRVFAVATTAILSAHGLASAGENPKWGAHVDMGGWLGTNRNLGELDLFLPLAQSNRTLLFGDLRIRADDDGNNEGNFALALRHMLPGGWNVGAYGYYDRKRIDLDNYFNQATLGVEALGRDFDLRANAYLPFGERAKDIGSTPGGGSYASIVGTAIQITTLGPTIREERALQGFDAEIGWRVPIWAVEDNKALRLYAGMFHFDDDIVEAVAGPRLRAELTMYELPYLPEESRLTLGAEFLEDDVRGSQGFAIARLRIPLQTERKDERRLNWQERRMTDYVMRDVDIVTEKKTTQAPDIVETATQTADGEAVTVISSATTGGAALPDAVAAAGDNSTVILTGSFNTTTVTAVQSGQTLMGAGTLAVRSASGRVADLTAPGASISNTTSASIAVLLGSGATLTGMTVSAIETNAVGAGTGARIENNIITATGSAPWAVIGIATSADDVVITGNTITVSNDGGGDTMGITMGSASNILVANNIVSVANDTPGAVKGAFGLNGTSIAPGSTGNTVAAGPACYDYNPANPSTGTIEYNGGATCP